jgi:hypothetical protein
MTINNNQDLIDGLRKAADWLEAKPEFPCMGAVYGSKLHQTVRLWARDKPELRLEVSIDRDSLLKMVEDEQK